MPLRRGTDEDAEARERKQRDPRHASEGGGPFVVGTGVELIWQ